MSKIHKLPLRIQGLKAIPAVPFEIKGLLSTLARLGVRAAEMKQASQGLSNVYTIDGITAPAYPFLFGESDSTQDSDSSSTAADADSAAGSKAKSGLARFASEARELASGAKEKIEDLVEDGTEAVRDLLSRGDSKADVKAAESHRADHVKPSRDALRARVEKDGDDIFEYLKKKVSKKERQPLPQPAPTSMTGLSLDDPKQFAMSWTTFADIYRDALPHLDPWAATLTDADEASRLFWPTIADYGLPYNLLILKKISSSDAGDLKSGLGEAWGADLDASQAKGNLYVIDMTIFETVEPQEVDGFERFTPATLTMLRQDPKTKALTPIAVRVSGHGGTGAQYFIRGQASDGAWIYALQAAKVSITVYGIWLGHVYHWHIVTAAMQMTMFNNVSEDHPLYQLLAPQSQHLISFDNVLLLLWEAVAPPTSIVSAHQFLELCNTFAQGRDYFDDDPTTTVENLGLKPDDFTVSEPWDQYPAAGQLLEVWRVTAKYVETFVDTTYADDAAVAGDDELQAWMKDAADKEGGNIRGLPAMDTRAALARVLTSLVYRVTVHGNSRLKAAANPGLTFVANYPPCLQVSKIPAPSAPVGSQELLRALPKTGTIAKMLNFYFTFGFSAPYESFIPIDGIEKNLFFDGGMSDPRNQALVAFRKSIIEFMTDFENGSPQINQWPLSIET